MDRLIAISDIHGCFDAFYELVINRIGLSRNDKLVLLGDYIDRGDKIRELIDFIIELRSGGYNVIPLIGNHEAMLLESYHNPAMQPFWFINNGASTLQSFRLEDVTQLDSKYLVFFINLEYFHTDGKFIFVHAGFNNSASDPFSDKENMLWDCYENYTNPILRDHIIIHGHRPKKLEYVRNKIATASPVIPIDTGCVYGSASGYGFLSALIVNNMQLISVAGE